MNSLLKKCRLMSFFQRDGRTEDGYEVYLWYDSDWASWLISQGDNFQARNDICWIYIETSGKQ